MKITDVKILPLNNIEGTKLVAVASIVLDNEFVIHGIRIINGSKGLFISMPSKKVENGFEEIVHLLNPYIKNFIETAILNEYNNLMTNNS